MAVAVLLSAVGLESAAQVLASKLLQSLHQLTGLVMVLAILRLLRSETVKIICQEVYDLLKDDIMGVWLTSCCPTLFFGWWCSWSAPLASLGKSYPRGLLFLFFHFPDTYGP